MLQKRGEVWTSFFSGHETWKDTWIHGRGLTARLSLCVTAGMHHRSSDISRRDYKEIGNAAIHWETKLFYSCSVSLSPDANTHDPTAPDANAEAPRSGLCTVRWIFSQWPLQARGASCCSQLHRGCHGDEFLHTSTHV